MKIKEFITMKNPAEVVMIPTEDKTLLYISALDNKPALHGYMQYLKTTPPRNQHLYITVSQDVEPIKEGDWCYDLYTKEILKRIKFTNGRLLHCKKIIATTDPKLIHSGEIVDYKGLPYLSQSFLKEFIANPDGKWEVEYETAGNWVDCKINSEKLGQECKECGELNYASDLECECGFKLKINQDNTVNITCVEEKMYTKEEYEAKIKSITLKEIRDAKSIQHTFGYDTFGKSLLYILNRLD
jgi:hypothetical protein